MKIQGILIKDLNVVKFKTFCSNIWFKDTQLPPNKDVTIPYDQLDHLSIQTKSSSVIGFGDLTTQEYNNQLDELLLGNDTPCELSLDDRYRYDKFVAEHPPIHSEPVTVKTPIEFDIVQVSLDTGSPFITEIWTVAECIDSSRLYTVNTTQAIRSFFEEKCKSLGLSYDLPNHSGLRFAKVEHEYAFDDSWDVKTKFYGSLEMCKQFLANKESELTKILSLCKAKKDGIILNDSDWPELLDQAINIHKIFCKVLTMKSTRYEYDDCRKDIEKMLTLIKSKALKSLE